MPGRAFAGLTQPVYHPAAGAIMPVIVLVPLFDNRKIPAGRADRGPVRQVETLP